MFIDFSFLCASCRINPPFPLSVCEYVKGKSGISIQLFQVIQSFSASQLFCTLAPPERTECCVLHGALRNLHRPAERVSVSLLSCVIYSVLHQHLTSVTPVSGWEHLCQGLIQISQTIPAIPLVPCSEVPLILSLLLAAWWCALITKTG